LEKNRSAAPKSTLVMTRQPNARASNAIPPNDRTQIDPARHGSNSYTCQRYCFRMGSSHCIFPSTPGLLINAGVASSSRPQAIIISRGRMRPADYRKCSNEMIFRLIKMGPQMRTRRCHLVFRDRSARECKGKKSTIRSIAVPARKPYRGSSRFSRHTR
jgi:hypothetical protein